ncbi:MULTISPECIES: HutD family protein [unclassified Streptomyces]|uniref:HutD/Ves family protein n=1 Tax=unclassified Streptomyces TaxID=2593676 RepID=UPI0006F9A41E|nr:MULTISPECIES: HutD family protein [unclassified Streptomyces]KQX56314.1 HutD family protein [Streptomyces sp. Root1304]KRA97129.1 HutD family protein [Streptomyces sp. Root66D1]
MSHFDVETLAAGRWRNGGGATREIVSRPEGAEAFEWRASIADIDRGGPFSEFPGVDRTLTLLAGDGVRLTSTGVFDRLLARPGEPFAFSGDLALSAELPGGACRVLNIMVRRGRGAARVERVAGPVVPPVGHAGVLHVLRGRWRTEADGHVMTAGQGVWWDGVDDAPGGAVVPLSPDADALWADVAPVG